MVYIYSALFCSLLCVNYFSIGLCCLATPNKEAVSATATTKRRTTTTAASVTTTTAAGAAAAIGANTAVTTTTITTTTTTSADPCVNTCVNLGCATGVTLTTGLFAATAQPNCGGAACPVGCACTICNGNTNCAANTDAVNYCTSIGCFSGDCDGGIINCFACPTTTTQKVVRAASDAINAACAAKCVSKGCGSGFIDNFVEPGTAQVAGALGCVCSVCPATTPCSSVATVTTFCQSIGCLAGANNPTATENSNANNANNACDFGVSACFTC